MLYLLFSLIAATAIMLNSILAQTIYTCFADAFKTPVLKQFSSIVLENLKGDFHRADD